MPHEFRITDEVRSYPLDTEDTLFEELFASVRFEDTGKGRQGAVLVKPDAAECIPIVRTTTRYQTPAQRFRPVHERLARRIQDIASLPMEFNNALIENYSHAYTTMGGHSDQALDLADGSFIAIFSCYQYPELANPPRKLLVESKESDSAKAEIPLLQNHVVVFSVAANRRLRHKIVLNASRATPENRWLGITFRTSGTFVRYRGNRACFLDDVPLNLANDDQKREFFHLRRRENQETDFAYPRLTYTISESDVMRPEF